MRFSFGRSFPRLNFFLICTTKNKLISEIDGDNRHIHLLCEPSTMMVKLSIIKFDHIILGVLLRGAVPNIALSSVQVNNFVLLYATEMANKFSIIYTKQMLRIFSARLNVSFLTFWIIWYMPFQCN